MTSCAICDNPALFRCGKCKVERYCSRECQKDHWPHHKTRCAQLAAEAKAPAAAQTASKPQAPPPPAKQQPAAPSLQPKPPPQALRPTGPQPHPRTSRLLADIPPSLQPNPSTSSPPPPPALSSPSPAGAQEAAAPGNPAAAAAGDSTSASTTFLTASHVTDSSSSDVTPQPTPPLPAQSASVPYPRPTPPLAPRPPSTLPQGGRPQPPLRPVGPRGRDSATPLTPAAAASSSNSAIPPSGRPDSDRGRAGGVLFVDATSTTGTGSSNPDDSTSFPAPPRLTESVGPTPPSPPTAPTAGSGGGGSLTGAPPPPWARPRHPPGGQSAQLYDMPYEIIFEVLKVLPARSLAVAAAVCRTWRRAAREPWLWVRQLCVAGYTLPAAAYIVSTSGGGGDGEGGGGGGTCQKDAAASSSLNSGAAAPDKPLRAVAGVRGIRAVRAVRAAGGSSHEDFLGGLRAGFLDRLQHQATGGGGSSSGGAQGYGSSGGAQGHGTTDGGQAAVPLSRSSSPQKRLTQHHHHPPTAGDGGSSASAGADLKALYGRTVRMESNWRSARYAESAIREHSSNVECLSFVPNAEPWGGGVLASAAWDGSVRVFALGSAGVGAGSPPPVRCVRRYHGHSGWITSMAAGRHSVVTASTDRRVAAWRYVSESPEPWLTLEHPQEVTLVRFCYAPPPPPTTAYLAHHLTAHYCTGGEEAGGEGGGGGGGDDTMLAGARWTSGGQGWTLSGGEGAAGGGNYSHDRYGSNGGGWMPYGSSCVLPYDPAWEDWVVTGCIDGLLRLWHLPTKQLLRRFAGHTDVVWGIAVLYGSSVMVSSSRDGSIKLWQLPALGLVQQQVAAAAPAASCADRHHGSVAALGLADGVAGGGAANGPAVTEAAATAPLATLCGHSSAVLCIDTHRVPPGVLPPTPPPAVAVAAAHGATANGTRAHSFVNVAPDAGGGRRVLPDEVLGVHADMLNTLFTLLNADPLAPAANGMSRSHSPTSASVGGLTTAATSASVVSGTKAAGGGAASTHSEWRSLPVWLVATGGADAVVRVWNLASAQCLATLRGHPVGVLSVQFGYLPRYGSPECNLYGSDPTTASHRDCELVPPDLLLPPAPHPSLALPPGQYGSAMYGSRDRRQQRQVLPPSQRLVLVTGSVREVRVWDPLVGSPLLRLEDHNGPVTCIALVHGIMVTLAMNDGLIVYKCNGLGPEDDEAPGNKASGAPRSGGGSGGEPGTHRGGGRGGAAAGPDAAGGRGGAVGGRGPAASRLRAVVAAERSPLEPVLCMQDPHHRVFAAALAVNLEGLAVGSGTGDVTLLDFRPRASPLPPLAAVTR